ncbi:FUSC family protein [Roseateles amylovorans]|uniref:FUSC family protein n=1 Tax=Roseateles amylovorans TaxID=2978473 RepID=UPI003F496C5E
MPAFLTPGFSRAEWLFSVKAFAAAMLAVFLASWAGQPRPFWALMTAYVVAHPLAGAVRSKGLFRFIGTLVGSVAAVLLVPRFANAPELLSLALALWVAGCLSLSLLDRTPRAYAFMLAGYTAALIGFPSVDTPLQIFDTAIARVEEIGLGILSATLVHSLVWPNSLAGSVLGLLDRTLGDTRSWLSDIAARRDGGADRRRVAGDITQLRLLSIHIPFDTSHLRWTADAVHAMQDRIAALTPLLAGVEDRLQTIEAHEGHLPAEVVAVLARLGPWLALPPAEAAAAMPALRADLARWTGDAEATARSVASDASDASDASVPSLAFDASDALDPPVAPEASHLNRAAWSRLLRTALAERLDLLLDGWLHCVQLRADIDLGLSGAPMPSRPAPALSGPKLHRDTGMALWSGAAALTAILVCCAFWILTGWPMGSAAAMMAAIFCCFFAAMDDPVPAINGFLKWTVLSMPVGALYVLVLLPLVQDMWTLMAVCAPVFLLVGAYVGRPATLGSALPFLFGVIGTLAMHDTSQADLPSFLNSMLGQLAGVFVAARVTRLMRSVGADWSARRIQRTTWRELEALARLPRSAGRSQAYLLRMLDRISLLAPRVAQSGGSIPGVPTDDALQDLRLGADLVALQAVRHQLPSVPVQPVLDTLSAWLRSRIDGQIDPAPPALLERVDAALGRLVASASTEVPMSASVSAAVSALLGLRRTLFPSAPAPTSVLDADSAADSDSVSEVDPHAFELAAGGGDAPVPAPDHATTERRVDIADKVEADADLAVIASADPSAETDLTDRAGPTAGADHAAIDQMGTRSAAEEEAVMDADADVDAELDADADADADSSIEPGPGVAAAFTQRADLTAAPVTTHPPSRIEPASTTSPMPTNKEPRT